MSILFDPASSLLPQLGGTIAAPKVLTTQRRPSQFPVGSGIYSNIAPAQGQMIGLTPYVAPGARQVAPTMPSAASAYTAPSARAGLPAQRKPAAVPSMPSMSSAYARGMMPKVGQPKQDSQTDILRALYSGQAPGLSSALRSAAATGLQLSGYQDRPMTTGQILGAMLQAGGKEYQQFSQMQEAKEAEAAKAAEDLRRFEETIALQRAELAVKAGKPISEAGQAAVDAGLTPGTQEFRDFVTKITEVPMTEKQEIIFKEDYGSVTKEIEDTNKMAAALPEWQKVESMLLAMPDGEETGKLEQFLLPFKGWAASAGFLDGAEMAALERAESLNAAMKVIIPKMRAIGSGATSDFEFKNFEAAATSFGKRKDANLIIASTMRQTIEHKIKVTELKRQLTRELNQAPSPEQLEAAMIEAGIGSVFNTPFGREIDSKSLSDVGDELVRMADSGKLEPNSVVYLGKHAGEDGVNGFVYMTAEKVAAYKDIAIQNRGQKDG